MKNKNQKIIPETIITDDTNLDFNFIKKFEPKDTNGTFLKKAITFAFTKFDIEKFYKWTIKIAAVVMIPLVLMSYSKDITEIVMQKNKMEQSFATSQIDKKEQKVEELLNNKINLIKTFTKEDMDKTISFVKENEANDIKKINTLYWQIKFLSEQNSTRYPLNTYLKELSQLTVDTHNHYNHRILEISSTYTMIKQGAKLFDPTYDNQNPIEKILVWKNSMETKNYSSFQELANYNAKWNPEFSRHNGLESYVELNAKDIQNEPLFK